MAFGPPNLEDKQFYDKIQLPFVIQQFLTEHLTKAAAFGDLQVLENCSAMLDVLLSPYSSKDKTYQEQMLNLKLMNEEALSEYGGVAKLPFGAMNKIQIIRRQRTILHLRILMLLCQRKGLLGDASITETIIPQQSSLYNAGKWGEMAT